MRHVLKIIAATGSGTAAAAFSPLSLSPTAWYDPSDLSTLWQDSGRTTPVTADGDVVGCIDDKSGNGFHLLQATTANKPLYKTGAGLHWLQYDGVDDFMSVASALGIGCATVVAGVMVEAIGNAFGLVTDTVDDATGVDLVFGENGSGSWLAIQGVGNTLSDANHVWSNQSQTVAITEDAARIYSADGTNYAGTPIALGSGLLVGNDRGIAGRYMTGRMYALALFADILSADGRNLVEDWMAAKSGVTL